MIFTLSGPAMAGSVIHNSNVSPEYIRTFTRNASSDAADAAHYNPAGTVWMANGLYLSIGNQFIMKEYSHSNTNASGVTTTWKDNKPVFLFPNMYVMFKQDKFAIFGGINVPGGGGGLDYSDGVYHPLINVASATGFTAHVNSFLGGAYKINDMFSVALTGRFIYGFGDVSSSSDTALLKEYDAKAQGFGGVLSLNARPIKGLTIALRYESVIKLEWEMENNEDAFISVGEKRQEDLPPVLAFGISYAINPAMRVEMNFNLYMSKQATWEHENDFILGDDDNFQDRHDNGYDLAGSFEYKLNQKLALSVGAMWTVGGAGPDSFDYLRPATDVFTLGLGATYSIDDSMKVTIAASNSWYLDGELNSDSSGDKVLDLSKSATVLAIGFQYRFPMSK
jgi:long-chain fatty acid transport protein